MSLEQEYLLVLKSYRKFVEKIQRLRTCQKEYFNLKSFEREKKEALLQQSRIEERNADRLILEKLIKLEQRILDLEQPKLNF